MNLAQEYHRHLAHQSRELYEFNIDEPCPCGRCQRDRFEMRACAVIIGAVTAALVALWWGLG